MALTLPPSIRPYWTTLLAEKAAAPDHREWEWAADPFAAKHEVEARQKKKADKDKDAKEKASGGAGGGSGRDSGRSTPAQDGSRGGKAWAEAPEVRMAPALREMVEDTVKKVSRSWGSADLQMMKKFPAAVTEATREMGGTPIPTPGGTPGASGTATPALDVAPLQAQLDTLGFRATHVASCLSALSAAHARLHSSGAAGNDPLVLSLSILSPLEAAIEWLLLHLPEDDLPPRYRPSASSANMVTGASVAQGGKSALVRGWLADKLARQAGFPRKAVEGVLDSETVESRALDVLGRKLCGWHGEEGGWGVTEVVEWSGNEDEAAERDVMREEELMALEAVLGERFTREAREACVEITVEMAHGDDTLMLNVVFDSHSPYPSPQHPTRPPAFYLSSTTLPSYMRLHLHATMLAAFRDPERHDLAGVLETGMGGAVLSMVEHLETTLPGVIEAPPDIGSVTQHLVPRAAEEEDAPARVIARREAPKARRNGPRREPSAAENAAVAAAQARLFADPKYAPMLADRKKLPAWAERENICSALDSNRVLVVVGETGCGKR